MSGTRQRRHFTGAEKMAILLRHLVDKVPVSQLCEEQGIHPTLLYGWQKALFENGAMVFDAARGPGRHGRQEEAAGKRIEALTDNLRRKDEVLSELMEEHVALEKVLGKPEGDLGGSRHVGRDRGFRTRLVGAHGDRREAARGRVKEDSAPALPERLKAIAKMVSALISGLNKRGMAVGATV